MEAKAIENLEQDFKENPWDGVDIGWMDNFELFNGEQEYASELFGSSWNFEPENNIEERCSSSLCFDTEFSSETVFLEKIEDLGPAKHDVGFSTFEENYYSVASSRRKQILPCSTSEFVYDGMPAKKVVSEIICEPTEDEPKAILPKKSKRKMTKRERVYLHSLDPLKIEDPALQKRVIKAKRCKKFHQKIKERVESLEKILAKMQATTSERKKQL